MKARLKVFMLPTYHRFNKYCPALINSIRLKGVDVRFLPEETLFFPLFRIARFPGLPQIVHLHWIDEYTIKKRLWRSLCASLIYIFELLLLRALGVKIVWTVHDYINLREKFPYLDILIRRFTVRLCNAIIVHTKAAGIEMTNLYKLSDTNKSKIRVIPHGHFLEQYPNNLSQAGARQKLGLDKDIFVFGFIGYIRPYKGIIQLIKAFRQLDGDNSHLLIAGMPFDASFGNAVKEATNGDRRIHLYLKFIEDEELQVFLNSTDVMVFPYTRSLTSGSMILAMSFGKAIVTSNCAFVPEVLPPEGGLIYSTENPEGLVMALREILLMDVISMGQKNLKQACAVNWQSMAKATVNVYYEILGDSTTKTLK